VATTDVEAALTGDPGVAECTVFGVEVPDTGGRAGMAAIKLRDGAQFDAAGLAEVLYDRLPGYALPLFVRIVDSLETTSTFKSRKVDLRNQAYGPEVSDPLYVLGGREEGYVPFYSEYPAEVAAGRRPRG
jgi:fatty-acyl-CoA synthase